MGLSRAREYPLRVAIAAIRSVGVCLKPNQAQLADLVRGLEKWLTERGLEVRLDRQRYLVGDQLTEADWRLFTTLVRFDAVYVGHFNCNKRRLADYPNLWAYTRELYQVPGVAETVDLHHIKHHYYGSHAAINPTGIVPAGPEIDYTAPHDRDRLDAA